MKGLRERLKSRSLYKLVTALIYPAVLGTVLYATIQHFCNNAFREPLIACTLLAVLFHFILDYWWLSILQHKQGLQEDYGWFSLLVDVVVIVGIFFVFYNILDYRQPGIPFRSDIGYELVAIPLCWIYLAFLFFDFMHKNSYRNWKWTMINDWFGFALSIVFLIIAHLNLCGLGVYMLAFVVCIDSIYVVAVIKNSSGG